ncbi:DUF4239 domain-containing protein [Larkinella insperata]|uniref:DUF4239 domain-containing protein n=1 Tax=Larkinella insperata TaxID=332158 RepID=A0ABW3Q6L6_9BACT
MATTALYSTLFDTLPANVLCLLFVVMVALISLAGLHLHHLYVETKTSAQNNEVVGIIFGAVSLIYSLILAFVILAVWQDYDELRKTIASEADRLNSILAHSATLPQPIQQPIKAALTSYCNQVVAQEWSTLHPSQLHRPSAIPDLRLMLLQLQPQTKLEENIYAVLDEDLSCVSDLRRSRLSFNQSHVPDLVWFILNTGSIMLIIFYYFLNVPSMKLKRFYLTFLSGYIAMCMFLVYRLDRPFAGREQISSKPYLTILEMIKQEQLTQK